MLIDSIRKLGRCVTPALVAGATVFAAPAGMFAQTTGTAKPAPEKKAVDDKAGVEKAAPAAAKPVTADKSRASMSAGPAAPAAKPVKPGSDIPQPTVVLKEGEKPAVKFDTPIYDFGKVRSGSDVEHEFWFTNTGNGPLEILRVKPSCGCTVAGEYDKVVAPGQTGKIPLKVRLGGASGQIAKSVTVNTNIEGDGAAITLQIKGEVWQPVQVTPPSAAFGRLTIGDVDKNPTRKLTIVNNLDDALKLGEPTCTSPLFKAAVTTLEEGKKYELTVTLAGPLVSGNNSGTISIPTGIAQPPKVDVAVYAFVTAPVDVTPTSLALPTSRTGDLTRQFYIRSNADKAVKLTDLKSPSPEIKLELTDIKDSKTYRLKVDIAAAYVHKPGDQITLKTDDPTVPTLSIPISATPVMTGAAGANPATRQQIRQNVISSQSAARQPGAAGTKASTVDAKPAPAGAAPKASETGQEAKPAGH